MPDPFLQRKFSHSENSHSGFTRIPILFRVTAGMIALCALSFYFLMNEPEASAQLPDENYHAKVLSKRVISFSGSKVLNIDFEVPRYSRAFVRVLSDIDSQRQPIYAGYRFRYYRAGASDKPCLDVFASEGMNELLANFENRRKEGSMMLAWNEL